LQCLIYFNKWTCSQKRIFTLWRYNSNVYSITYKLYNESDNVIWLWIEKEDFSELSDSIKARRYFYKRKGDFSLYHLALDGNVASMVQSVFSVFVKRIEPKSVQKSEKKGLIRAQRYLVKVQN